MGDVLGFIVIVLIIGGGIYGLWVGGAFILALLGAFFAFGSLPFWVMVGIAALAIWILVEAREDGASAVIPFILFCVFTHFIAGFNLVHWVRDNTGYLTSRAFWYLTLGFVYALSRWILHVRRKASELDKHEKQYRHKFPFEGSLDTAPESVRYDFGEYLQGKYFPNIAKEGYGNHHDVRKDGVIPSFNSNKYTVLRWFWWWPFSLLGWMLNDFLRELFDAFKRVLRWFTDGISQIIFGRRNQYVLSQAAADEFEKKTREAKRAAAEEAERGRMEPRRRVIE